MQQLLESDMRCHEQMAMLQELFHNGTPEDYARIRKRCTRFASDVEKMIAALDKMNPGAYSSLWDYHRKFDFYTRYLLAPPRLDSAPPYILRFADITPTDKRVGNKTRHLAILHNELDILTPEGFAIQASAFHRFIQYNQLRARIDSHLEELSIDSQNSLETTSLRLMELIRTATVPPDLEEAINAGCDTLLKSRGKTKFAVRSSGMGEDGDSSFAGQFTTLLDIDQDGILDAYREVLASKYSSAALYYRIHQGWGDEETAMTALVMPMVPALISGVLYTGTIGDDQDGREPIHLHVVKGRGESLVGGMTVPETYLIDRSPPHTIAPQLPDHIPSASIHGLATEALRMEQYFNSPQDIEWAIDENSSCHILQTRNLRRSRLLKKPNPQSAEKHRERIIVSDCEKASAGTATGPIYILNENTSLGEIPPGSILVTRNTPPSYVRFMQKAAAVLSISGSKASHFATVAREFSIPYLSGITHCLELFQNGEEVTVDGYSGRVYRGVIEELVAGDPRPRSGSNYRRIVSEAAKFLTTLDLTDPNGKNFTPEGCRSMHDIIRFCHEKAIQSMFSTGKPGSARGARRLEADTPIDVYLFDIGGGIAGDWSNKKVPLEKICSSPFLAVWRGLSHPGVQWKQKPFDWNAYERIELSGAVPPKMDDFAFASYAVIASDYLHFHIRFGYHFTILDVLCGPDSKTNHCLFRFAGGGGDFDHRSLRIHFLSMVLERLGFEVENKGDLLEAKYLGGTSEVVLEKLDLVGRLFGATKLMDMVLKDEEMVKRCVEDFFHEKYSFSERG